LILRSTGSVRQSAEADSPNLRSPKSLIASSIATIGVRLGTDSRAAGKFVFHVVGRIFEARDIPMEDLGLTVGLSRTGKEPLGLTFQLGSFCSNIG